MRLLHPYLIVVECPGYVTAESELKAFRTQPLGVVQYHVELCRPSIARVFSNPFYSCEEAYICPGRSLFTPTLKQASELAQSLLHGSPEAKKEGELEVSQHSKIVGRGKYVHGFESKLIELS